MDETKSQTRQTGEFNEAHRQKPADEPDVGGAAKADETAGDAPAAAVDETQPQQQSTEEPAQQ